MYLKVNCVIRLLLFRSDLGANDEVIAVFPSAASNAASSLNPAISLYTPYYSDYKNILFSEHSNCFVVFV